MSYISEWIEKNTREVIQIRLPISGFVFLKKARKNMYRSPFDHVLVLPRAFKT